LRDISKLNLPKADGIWASFTAAYFTDFGNVLKEWASLIKKDGWIAIVEADNLFGHSPLADDSRSLIESFYNDAFTNGRHDFRIGSRLHNNIKQAGLLIEKESIIADAELSAKGQVQPEVLEAWKNRLSRMKGLQRFAGEKFTAFQSDFLSALDNPNHESQCRVIYVLVRNALTNIANSIPL